MAAEPLIGEFEAGSFDLSSRIIPKGGANPRFASG